jgi:isopenicillin N synthase-like dioxygenase
LHGPNLYPEHPAELGPCIKEWFNQMSKLGQTLLSGIALALGMPEDWFATSIARAQLSFSGFSTIPRLISLN